MPKLRYRYHINCTQARGEDIQRMVDRAQELSWEECWEYLDRAEVHRALGYAGALTLETDWTVPKPCKSAYRGLTCIFITHSAIEYVYLKEVT